MELSDRLAACLAASSVGELIGGHQAHVFEVTYGDGRRGVAKVLDASLVDAATVARRFRSSPSLPISMLASVARSRSMGAANLHQLNGSIKIFDFDDCGYGPRAFDVANALYMVLFDAAVHHARAPYEPFKAAFVSGYTDEAALALDADVLTSLIDHRVSALSSWLDDLRTAPTGIRTASPEWHGVLRSFVVDYNARK